MADWIGRTIGKVHIESLIARGGMAEVYLGTHSGLSRQVAVKVMRGQLDKDSDAMVRFQREAQVVASLRHPNIIQMLDYDFIDEQPYLVMEYIPGPTLANYLKELHKRGEKLPLEITSRIIAALAQALDYAHSNGIVHRDVKPANVLLRSPSTPININEPLPSDVEPILTDFGLVRHLESSVHTTTGTVSGTPTYMSPEQARGDKVDARTDIYSLGVMFYEMLSGSVPFESDSAFGVLLKHINEAPAPIPGISEDLQAIIDRAMSKDPQYRYERASEMARDFSAIFNGQTISPATLTNARLARQTLLLKNKQPVLGTLGWAALGLLILGIFAAGFFLRAPVATSPANTVAPRANGVPSVSTPVGEIVFSDANSKADKSVLTLNLDPPDAGKHYEVWYLASGKVVNDAGKVDFGSGLDQGQLIFQDPNGGNLVGAYDQVEISLEADGASPTQPTQLLYSSVFPPKALLHVRHVLYMFGAAPNQIALIQGLWGTTEKIRSTADDIEKAYEAKDQTSLHKKIEELINLTVGSQNQTQYKDWDGDGTIDDPGDKFGLLDNGGVAYDTGQKISQGYIPQTISHAQYAAQAPDATANIISESNTVVTCISNVKEWSEQIVEKSVELNNTPFGAEMEPLISEIQKLSQNMETGADSNGNQLTEPIVGECGAETAYEHAYSMADMPILPGVDQMPAPASGATPKP